MYKFLVTFHARPGMRPKLLDAIRTAIPPTRAEPGCVAYDFFTSIDDDNAVVAVECFRSRADHAAHLATPHFQTLRPVLEAEVARFTVETIVDDEAAAS